MRKKKSVYKDFQIFDLFFFLGTTAPPNSNFQIIYSPATISPTNSCLDFVIIKFAKPKHSPTPHDAELNCNLKILTSTSTRTSDLLSLNFSNRKRSVPPTSAQNDGNNLNKTLYHEVARSRHDDR